MSTIPMSAGFLPRAITSEASPEVYKRSPSLAQVAGAAISSEWVTSWAWRTANAEWAYTPRDDNYFAADDKILWADLTRDVDPAYYGEIARANNPIHAMAIADNMRSVTRSRALLRDAGASGVVASIGAAILDPVSLAAGFGAGGIIGKSGLVASRAGSFALGGLAGVATEGSIETFLVSQDPDRGVNDIILATIGSFALGGVGELATRGNWGSLIAKAAERDRRTAVAAMGAAAPGEFAGTTLGRAAAAVDPDAATKAAFVRASLEERGLPQEFIDDVVSDPSRVDAEYGALTYSRDTVGLRTDAESGGPTDAPPPSTLGDGAEDDPFKLPPAVLGDFEPSRANDAAAKWTNVRGSFAAVLGNPKVPAPVRRLTNMLIDDVLPKVGNQASTYAASMWVHTKVHATKIGFHKSMAQNFAEFSKATGIRGRRGIERFARDVLNVVERPELLGAVTDNPAAAAIKSAAADVSKLFESQLGMMQRHGVSGMDRFDSNRLYIPLMLNPSKVRAATTALGEDKVIDFLATALQRGSEDMGFDTAQKIAKMKLRVMQGVGQFSDMDRFKNFQGKQLEGLRNILESQPFDEMTDELVESIMARVDDLASDAESGVPTFGRRRTNWDLAYTENLTTLSGEALNNKGVRDLLYETNLFNIVDRYVRTATGAAALHRTWNEAAKSMGRKTPFRTRQAFESAVGDALRKENIDTANGFGRKFMEHLRVAQKHIAGVPLFDEDQALQKTSRVLRKYNYVNRSGGFGFAQLPELGKVMGFAGVINTINSVPVLKSFSKKFPTEMLETAEMLGLGSDHWINETLSHLDPDDLIEFDGGGLMNSLDRGLTRAGRAASFMSGFNHVNAGLQRLNTVATIQKFVSDAVGNRKWNTTKLAALGLSPDDATRIFKAIDDEVARGVAIKREPGLFAKRVARFHLSKFQDQEAAQRLLESINTFSRRVVQDSSLGSSLMLMHKPWAKLMFQFQNFALQAWEKQLLYSGATVSDPRTWAAAMLGTMMGAMVYTAQQHLYSIGQADKDEFLDSKLGTPEERGLRIFRAGIQRSGVFSVLPWGVDFLSYALGQDPVFDARNTGQSFRDAGTFGILGPTGQSISDAARAMQGIATGIAGDDYSQSDFGALRRIAPWQASPIIRNMLDAAGSRLEIEEPEDE